MNKLFGAIVAITMLFSIDALVLTKSADAQITCKHDFFGNYVCSDNRGNRSSTKRDFFGNDVTTFNNGSRMSCKHDFFGNYVCR